MSLVALGPMIQVRGRVGHSHGFRYVGHDLLRLAQEKVAVLEEAQDQAALVGTVVENHRAGLRDGDKAGGDDDVNLAG